MGRRKGGKNKRKEQIRLDHDHNAHDESKKIINNPLVERNNNQISTEQQDNLKKTVNELTKKFGHSIVHFAKDEPDKEKIPFGIEAIDKLTGGGILSGMFTILWGNKSSAKTTLAYSAIAQAQKMGKNCLFLDLEGSFDKAWAEKFGVDLNRLLVGHFETAEEAMDTIIKLTNEKAIDFIILDSIQSLSPAGEQQTKKGKEKSVEDDTMALLARKLSQFFRMSASGVYKGKVAMLLIGQARTDLGSFIKLDALSGGHALQHWSAITLKSYRGTKADAPRYKFKVNGKTKEFIIGFDLVIKIEKTKVSGTAPESSEIRIPFHYEYGFIRPTDEQIEQLYSDWIEFEGEDSD